MKNILIGLLILIIFVQEDKAISEEWKQLEPKCGSYCFKVLTPVLDHAKALQSQVDDFKNQTGFQTKLKNHENMIQEILDAHDKRIKQKLDDISRTIELDGYIKRNGEFITKIQNIEGQLEKIEANIDQKIKNSDCSAQFQIIEQLMKIKFELQEGKWQKQIDNITSRIESMAKAVSMDILQKKFEALQSAFDTQISNTLKQNESINIQVQDKIDANNKNIEKKLNYLTARNKFREIGSKYYYIEESDKRNWFEAVDKCLALGGHLVSIQNLEEFNAIRAVLKPQEHYWLDFNDLDTDGLYISVTTGLPSTYFNWHEDNPNPNNSEHCGELWYYNNKHSMNDGDCDLKKLFICEPYFQ